MRKVEVEATLITFAGPCFGVIFLYNFGYLRSVSGKNHLFQKQVHKMLLEIRFNIRYSMLVLGQFLRGNTHIHVLALLPQNSFPSIFIVHCTVLVFVDRYSCTYFVEGSVSIFCVSLKAISIQYNSSNTCFQHISIVFCKCCFFAKFCTA